MHGGQVVSSSPAPSRSSSLGDALPVKGQHGPARDASDHSLAPGHLPLRLSEALRPPPDLRQLDRTAGPRPAKDPSSSYARGGGQGKSSDSQFKARWFQIHRRRRVRRCEGDAREARCLKPTSRDVAFELGPC